MTRRLSRRVVVRILNSSRIKRRLVGKRRWHALVLVVVIRRLVDGRGGGRSAVRGGGAHFAAGCRGGRVVVRVVVLVAHVGRVLLLAGQSGRDGRQLGRRDNGDGRDGRSDACRSARRRAGRRRLLHRVRCPLLLMLLLGKRWRCCRRTDDGKESVAARRTVRLFI